SPFPNSQIIDVYGVASCFEIAYQANQAFQDAIQQHGYAHLPDVQTFLLSELNAAYRFLAEPSNQQLWTMFCTPDLVRMVRARVSLALTRRGADSRAYSQNVSSPPLTEPRPQSLSITAALAWCILVDAALLNDRLIMDMKETAAAKGCAPFCAG